MKNNLNKIGSVTDQFVEVYSGVGFVIAFLLSLVLINPFFMYTIVAFIGFILGRLLHKSKKDFLIIVISFFIFLGFFLGSFFNNSNWKWELLHFIIMIWLGNYIHKKGYM